MPGDGGGPNGPGYGPGGINPSGPMGGGGRRPGPGGGNGGRPIGPGGPGGNPGRSGDEVSVGRRKRGGGTDAAALRASRSQ